MSSQITRWRFSAARTRSEVIAPPPSASAALIAAVQQLECDLLLPAAERGLAVLGEDALDRLAGAGFDHLVDIERVGREGLGGAGGGGRLAGAHEPNADDVAVGRAHCCYRRHPIRSS